MKRGARFDPSGRFRYALTREWADDGGLVVYALDQTEQGSLETQFFQSQKMDLVGQLALLSGRLALEIIRVKR